MPNPSVVAGNTNSGSFTSGTAVTVSSTGSVNAGDLMVCVLTVGGASAPSALAPPAGWTTFLTTTANVAAGTIVTAIFYRANPTAGAFSGSFTWTTTATSGSWGFFVLNQPGALLVDGSVVTAQNASGTKTSPTITPGAGNVADTLICAIIGAVAGVDTITQPAGMTSIANIAGTSTQPFFSIASLGLASSSATGTKTWTVPTSQTCLGVSLLIQQGPVSGFESGGSASGTTPVKAQAARQRYAATKGKSEFAVYSRWANLGTEIQTLQPPHQRSERSGALMLGDDGTQAPRINFANFGWPVTLHQPSHPRPERSAAIAIGDPGNQAKFVPPTAPPPHDGAGFFARPGTTKRAGAIMDGGEDGNEGKFSFWFNYGWETQPPQPGHPRTERSGAVAIGDFGAYLVTAPVVAFTKWGWDIQPPPPRFSSTRQRYPATKGKSEFRVFANPFGWGFEAALPPGRMAGPTIVQRGAGAAGESTFAAFNLTAWAEIQNWQPSYLRSAHRVPMIGDPGNQAVFIPPATTPVLWGLDPPPFTRRNVYRAGTFTQRDVETPLIGFFPFGWMVQPVQPGHPSPEKRAGGIAKGDEGNAAPQINFFPAGWQIQPHQPQHPRPERAGAIMVGEPGNEGVFSFIAPVFVPDGYNPTAFMPRVRFARAGSLARGEDGTEGLYSVWLPSGWQRPDPAQRPRRGAAGAIQEGWRGGEQPGPVAQWGFDPPDAMLRRQSQRSADHATTFVPVSAVASFTWGDLDSGVLARTRRRLRSDDVPFSPHALGARFQWGQIDPAMTFPTRRRTLTRAEFHIEGKFVFVPPLPLNIVFNPDNLLRRSFFHPGAAIMQFDGGWFQQRYVSVFFASSIITQASGDTAVTAATGQTVLSNQA